MRNQLIDGSPQHELHLQRCNRKREPPVIKCASLVTGKKLGAPIQRGEERESERARFSSSWNFYSSECVAPRPNAVERDGRRGARAVVKSSSPSPPLSLTTEHRSNFCGISADEEATAAKSQRGLDAHGRFYKNHSREIKVDHSQALTDLFLPAALFLFFLLPSSLPLSLPAVQIVHDHHFAF